MSTSRRPRLRRRLERGATAAIVAVMLAGGVLLGAAALAVDVGNMMFERRQLQNGADAAAFKLAEICDDDVTQCSDTLGSTQKHLREVLALCRTQEVSPHLEVETYTWDVLPEGLKSSELATDIVRELQWVRTELGA